MDADQLAQLFAALKKEPPPKYDGKTNISDWLVVFKQNTGSGDASRLSALPGALTGHALEWYCAQERRTDKPTTFKDYEEAMTKYFKRSSESIRDELENRKQGATEESLEYFREVMRLCTLLDPTMSQEAQVRYLIRGLRPDIQRDMILLKPKTPMEFQEFLPVAAKTAALAATSSDSKDKLVDTLVALLTEKTKSKEVPFQATSSTQEPNTFGGFFAEDQRRKQFNRESRGYSRGRGDRGRGQGRGGNNRSLQCHYCGKANHYAYECHSFKKDVQMAKEWKTRKNYGRERSSSGERSGSRSRNQGNSQ